jgi:hypothetical protein
MWDMLQVFCVKYGLRSHPVSFQSFLIRMHAALRSLMTSGQQTYVSTTHTHIHYHHYNGKGVVLGFNIYIW